MHRADVVAEGGGKLGRTGNLVYANKLFGDHQTQGTQEKWLKN